MSAKEMAKRAAAGAKNAAAAERARQAAAALKRQRDEQKAAEYGRTHYYEYCMKQIEEEADRGKRSTSYHIWTTDRDDHIGASAEALAAKLRKEGYSAKVGGWSSHDADMGDSAAPCHVTVTSVDVEVSW